MSTPFTTESVSKNFSDVNIPIISVGSGMGKREQELIDLGHKVICIDPFKGRKDRWTSIKRVRKRDFKNVPSCMEKHKELIGNCYVLIEYPQTDYITYDFCSLYDLQPLETIILTTRSCQSGGLLLHFWLNKYGIQTTNKEKTRSGLEQSGISFNEVHLPYTLNIVEEQNKKTTLTDESLIWIQQFIFIKGTRDFEFSERDKILSPIILEEMGIEMGAKGVDRSIELIKHLSLSFRS